MPDDTEQSPQTAPPPTTEEYHSFVFDKKSRKFVGDFDGMYRAEEALGFDSWHQSSSSLSRRLALAHINHLTWPSILEVGCGKGYVTRPLTPISEQVTAIDVSSTALKTARRIAPQATFEVADAQTFGFASNHRSLSIFLEVLSYLENWRDVIKSAVASSDAVLIGLYLPSNPIGFVKTIDDCIGALGAMPYTLTVTEREESYTIFASATLI